MASARFYFDEMLARPAAEQLRQRGVQVTMAVDSEMTGKTDSEHLAFSTQLQLVMVTFDRPFATTTMENPNHAGLICLSSIKQNNIGGIVRLLSEFVELYPDEETTGQVFWL